MKLVIIEPLGVDQDKLLSMAQAVLPQDIEITYYDTRVSDTNLVGRFISDIVLQLLSFVAENERDNIRQRQAEGIAAAKRRGTKFGRPLTACPPDFPRIVQAYKNKQISCSEAMELSQMKPSTFFYYLKRCTKN